MDEKDIERCRNWSDGPSDDVVRGYIKCYKLCRRSKISNI